MDLWFPNDFDHINDMYEDETASIDDKFLSRDDEICSIDDDNRLIENVDMMDHRHEREFTFAENISKRMQIPGMLFFILIVGKIFSNTLRPHLVRRTEWKRREVYFFKECLTYLEQELIETLTKFKETIHKK
ncbi:unnamed protein product [Lactuca saligna]|uniref:Uncharacterized protein n=1 Tax=Lactuca saligna TaxID=75948 RepID=A0AA35UUV7_LACSI|nr:unnamed protein product [Lactuca saligna]